MTNCKSFFVALIVDSDFDAVTDQSTAISFSKIKWTILLKSVKGSSSSQGSQGKQ